MKRRDDVREYMRYSRLHDNYPGDNYYHNDSAIVSMMIPW